jgi:hypothetical protein
MREVVCHSKQQLCGVKTGIYIHTWLVQRQQVLSEAPAVEASLVLTTPWLHLD